MSSSSINELSACRAQFLRDARASELAHVHQLLAEEAFTVCSNNVFHTELLNRCSVRDVLGDLHHSTLVHCSPTDTVAIVHRMIVMHRITAVPVLEDASFVCFFTASDLARLVTPFVAFPSSSSSSVSGQPHGHTNNNDAMETKQQQGEHPFWAQDSASFGELTIQDALVLLGKERDAQRAASFFVASSSSSSSSGQEEKKEQDSSVSLPLFPWSYQSGLDVSLSTLCLQLSIYHRVLVSTPSHRPGFRVCSQLDVVQFLHDALTRVGNESHAAVPVYTALRAVCTSRLMSLGYVNQIVHSVWHHATVAEVLLAVSGHRHVSTVAILDDDGKVMGDFSSRDLDADAFSPQVLQENIVQYLKRTSQWNDPITMHQSDQFDLIVAAMVKYKSRKVWIVDFHCVPVGLVTATDVMRILIAYRPAVTSSPFVLDLPLELSIAVQGAVGLPKSSASYYAILEHKHRVFKQGKGSLWVYDPLLTLEASGSGKNGTVYFGVDGENVHVHKIAKVMVVSGQAFRVRVMRRRMILKDAVVGVCLFNMKWVAAGFGTNDKNVREYIGDMLLYSSAADDVEDQQRGENGAARGKVSGGVFLELHAHRLSRTQQLRLQQDLYTKAKHVNESAERERKERRRSATNGMISSWLLGSEVRRLQERQKSFMKRLEAERGIKTAQFLSDERVREHKSQTSSEQDEQDYKFVGKAAEEPVTEVLPGVFLGNKWNARDRDLFRTRGITHVVNVTRDVPHHFQHDKELRVSYFHLEFDDEGGEDLYNALTEAIEFIDDAVLTGKVLIHCFLGVSRSVVVAIAYAMRSKGMSLRDAYALVREKRSIAIPNYGFLRQLAEFEHVVYQHHGKPWKKASMSEEEMLEIASSHPGERLLAGVDRPELEVTAIAASKMEPVPKKHISFKGSAALELNDKEEDGDESKERK